MDAVVFSALSLGGALPHMAAGKDLDLHTQPSVLTPQGYALTGTDSDTQAPGMSVLSPQHARTRARTHVYTRTHTPFFPLPPTLVSGMATSVTEDGVNRRVVKLRADDIAFPQQERSCWKVFLVGQTGIKGNARARDILSMGLLSTLGRSPL